MEAALVPEARAPHQLQLPHQLGAFSSSAKSFVKDILIEMLYFINIKEKLLFLLLRLIEKKKRGNGQLVVNTEIFFHTYTTLTFNCCFQKIPAHLSI